MRKYLKQITGPFTERKPMSAYCGCYLSFDRVTSVNRGSKCQQEQHKPKKVFKHIKSV